MIQILKKVTFTTGQDLPGLKKYETKIPHVLFMLQTWKTSNKCIKMKRINKNYKKDIENAFEGEGNPQ